MTKDIEAALDYLERSQVLGETVVVQAEKLRTVLAHVRDLEAKLAAIVVAYDGSDFEPWELHVAVDSAREKP